MAEHGPLELQAPHLELQEPHLIGAREKPVRLPLVSVVIAAYQEGRYIEACLRSLLEQTYPRLEIVLVDDGSTDGTVDIAKRFPIRLLRQSHLGAGVARNLGARESAGDVLVFLDGDMVFPRPFIERLVEPILDGEATGTFTKEIMVANPHRRWARAHMLGRELPPDCHFPPDFPDRWENFRAIKRSAFERVGGFDGVGHGEDVTIGRKLGEDAVAAPGTVCWHFEPDTLRDIFVSARWLGRGERLRETGRRTSLRPWRLARTALSVAVANRRPSLFVYRLVWDTGILFGWLTRNVRPSTK